nr:TIGR02281 family clan AA aspartic protease [Novosphingobium profundi]
MGQQPLLALTIGAIVLAVAAQMVARRHPGLGVGMRNAAYLGMLVAGLLTVVGFASHNRTSDAALWLDHTQAALIEGGETVVAMRADGHFWVKAALNGEPVEFLIDTGATYTTVPQTIAERAGLTLAENGEGRLLDTANGTVVARMASARSLDFGNIETRGLALAVLPDAQNDTAVIGMNLLSQLASWRVEDQRLILAPRPASNAS